MQTIKTIILALALSVGASYIYAWTGPTATAPGGNVPAPINVGSVDQVKTAGLGLNSLLVNGPIQIKNGTEAAGKVLTSDANGVATWQVAAAASVPSTPAPSSVEGVPTGFKSSVVCAPMGLGTKLGAPTASKMILYYSYSGNFQNVPYHFYASIPGVGVSTQATSWTAYSNIIGFDPSTGAPLMYAAGASPGVLTVQPWSGSACQNAKI